MAQCMSSTTPFIVLAITEIFIHRMNWCCKIVAFKGMLAISRRLYLGQRCVEHKYVSYKWSRRDPLHIVYGGAHLHE